jgi:hypothetical protein
MLTSELFIGGLMKLDYLVLKLRTRFDLMKMKSVNGGKTGGKKAMNSKVFDLLGSVEHTHFELFKKNGMWVCVMDNKCEKAESQSEAIVKTIMAVKAAV